MPAVATKAKVHSDYFPEKVLLEDRRKRSYSFVVPIYNDHYLAEAFCRELESAFIDYLQFPTIAEQVELIFVDDGSPIRGDLESLTLRFPFVRVVRLSRNFGHHIALSCGYRMAKGDVVGTLNVDMQDPPRELKVILDCMFENKYDIVIGVRKNRLGSLQEALTGRLFVTVINFLTSDNLPVDFSCTRVMSRRFIDAYNQFGEKCRWQPGLERWLGFSRGFVKIEHQERKVGKSSYNFKKRLALAMNSIISFSDMPLKIASVVGMSLAMMGIFLGVALIIQKIFFLDILPGFTSIASLMLFFSGMQLIFIGIVGIYLGRILVEVQNRPLYVIESTHNFKSAESANTETG